MSTRIQCGGVKLVIGFGVSGQSLARHCIRNAMPFMIADGGNTPPDMAGLLGSGSNDLYQGALIGETFAALLADVEALAEFIGRFEAIYTSPGIPVSHLLVQKAQALGVPVLNDIALFSVLLRHDFPDVKMVAITGSNGKSTVTDATAYVGQQLGYSCYAIGNIGLAVLDIVPQLQGSDIVVVELSSYQLEIANGLGADVAVLLNISDDHLDRHGDLKTYWQAKQKVYESARAVVVNKDDPLSAPLEPHKQSGSLQKYCRFGLGTPDMGDFGIMQRGGERFFAKGVQPVFPIAKCKSQANYNLANFLAVLSIGECLGWALEAVCEAMITYTGLPYRCQVEPSADGIVWINDSKGTNVGATVVALQDGELQVSDAGRLWWIAGGLAKGANFSPLASVVQKIDKKSKLKKAFLYGQDRQSIANALEQKNIGNYSEVETLKEAVDQIKALARPGDVVVFSPACASMDQFANFEARGRAFSEYVQ